MTTPPTPNQAATAWAAANPNYSGALTVISTTRAGRGGWKDKTRYNLFYVADGRAVPVRYRPPRPGVCSFCNRVYVDPILQLAWGPEPLAGQRVPIIDLDIHDYYISPDGHNVYAATTLADLACPDCIKELGMTVGTNMPFEYDNTGVICAFRRLHPAAKYSIETIEQHTLDIRHATP